MKNNDLEKERLLLEQSQKDPKSFTELYNFYLNDVYRYSYSILNNQHDAEDVTSQAFVEFFKNLQKFEWRDVSLKYWLFRTAKNFAYKKFS